MRLRQLFCCFFSDKQKEKSSKVVPHDFPQELEIVDFGDQNSSSSKTPPSGSDSDIATSYTSKFKNLKHVDEYEETSKIRN